MVEHLILQLGGIINILYEKNETDILIPGIPIAYSRMVFLEATLASKLNPLIALGRKGIFNLSALVNKYNGEAEILDDLVCINSQEYST
jgi:hypothetical protein